MNKISLLFIGGVVLTSCSIKSISKTNFFSPKKNSNEIIKSVNKTNKLPKNIFLKGRVNIVQDTKKMSLNININCIKDSLIWTSVAAPLGIEIFRIQLSKDSIYFINRTKKTYFIKPISYIEDYLKIDVVFNDVYNIITGNPEIEKNSYSFDFNDSCYIINSNKTEYKINKTNHRIIEAVFLHKNNVFKYSFSSFKEYKGYIFPQKCSLESELEEKLLIKLRYDRVVFDKKHNSSFRIPDQYVKIQ